MSAFNIVRHIFFGNIVKALYFRPGTSEIPPPPPPPVAYSLIAQDGSAMMSQQGDTLFSEGQQ